MPAFGTPQLSPLIRRWLLVLSVSLTAGIVLFPVAMHYEYRPLESVDAFGNLLPLFAVIFYIWMAVLFLLLFSKNDTGEWQRAGLLSLFALGMVGIWIVNAPYGGHPDELWQMGHVKYILETGRIGVAHPVFNYFEFPAFHLLLASISRVTGLGVFESRLGYMFFSSVIFTVLSYLLFFRLLKDSRIASLGVLFLFLGCPLIASSEKSFWPGNLAQLLYVALLLLLAWREQKMHWVLFTLLFVVFFAGLTMSYLPTSVMFLFILAAIYVIQRINRSSLVPLVVIILVFVTFIVWQVSYANTNFRSMVQGLTNALTAPPPPSITEPAAVPTVISEPPPAPVTGPPVTAITQPTAVIEPSTVPTTALEATAVGGPKNRFSMVLELGAVFVGAGAPWWASVTKLLWLALIFGVGGVLSIRNLFRIRKLDPMETLETGGIWGVVVFTPVAFLLSPGGEQTGRFFLYAPFFFVPMVLRFLVRPAGDSKLVEKMQKPASWLRKNGFSLLIILVFLLSLPSFLATASRVLSHPIYTQENDAGEFLRDNYGDGELLLYSTPFTVTFYSYYVPDAQFKVLWPGPDVAEGKQGFWQAMDPLVEDFEKSTAKNVIFVVSQRLRHSYGPTIIIEEDDPEWIEFINRLEQNDKIYDNGFVRLYKHRLEQRIR